MSFSGHLEDLQLRDLLQILSLSHNSGLLQLASDNAQAELLFDDGLVVSAWRQGDGANDSVMAAVPEDLVDTVLLSHARQRQQKGEPFQTLDRLLVEEYGLAANKLSAALRKAVSDLTSELFGWEKGNFSFHAGPVLETLQQLACGEHVCLDKGLGQDDLLGNETVVLPGVEGGDRPSPASCSMDEERQICDDTGGQAPAVLLVDDDPLFRRLAVTVFANHGVRARCFATGRELLDVARACWRADHRPVLVIDLIMPRQHGGGLLGGLELVEKLRDVQPDLHCLVYSDYPCREIEQRLRHLGIDELLSKPRPDQPAVDGGDSATQDFCQQLAMKLTARLEGAKSAVAATAPDDIAGSAVVERVIESPGAPSGAGLGLLKGMLQEMQGVESSDQIMLLVLRFATELLQRAVLFSVGRERIVGLGQFGHGTGEVSADEKVRRILIPLSEPSSLRNVVEQTLACCGPMGEGEWDDHLRRELGLGQQDEVFIGPVLKDGRVVALLCGDNQSGGCGEDQRQMLEIFLQQAGAALERVRLTADLGRFSGLLGKSFGC